MKYYKIPYTDGGGFTFPADSDLSKSFFASGFAWCAFIRLGVEPGSDWVTITKAEFDAAAPPDGEQYIEPQVATEPYVEDYVDSAEIDGAQLTGIVNANRLGGKRPTEFLVVPTACNWVGTDLGNDYYWNQPVWNGEIWVAGCRAESNMGTQCGTSVAWSTDGKTWNKGEFPASAYWNQPVWNGEIWVTCSNISSNAAAWSTDGKTWIAATMPAIKNWNKPVWNGEMWVTCGGHGSADPSAAWSADGKTWNAATMPTSANWNQPVWNGEMWVTCGGHGSADPSAAWSTDGKTWNAATMPASEQWNQPVWNGEIWVTCGGKFAPYSTAAAWSTDGKTWNAATLPDIAIWNQPVWNGEIWLTCIVSKLEYGNAAAWSADGKTWNEAKFPASAYWNQPVWNGEMWVVCSNRCAVVTWSTDGKTWNASALPGDENWIQPIWNGEMWVTCGGESKSTNNLSAWSTDGKIWNAKTMPNRHGWDQLAWNGEIWVACGNAYREIAYWEGFITTVSGQATSMYTGNSAGTITAQTVDMGFPFRAIVIENTSGTRASGLDYVYGGMALPGYPLVKTENNVTEASVDFDRVNVFGNENAYSLNASSKKRYCICFKQ